MAAAAKSALLLLLISLLFLAVSARPCKTLFVYSYSFAVNPNPNPNSNSNLRHPFIGIITQIRRQSTTSSGSSSQIFLARRVFPAFIEGDDSEPAEIRRPELERDQEGDQAFLPFGLSSYDMSSLRDRTKDILSVVVSLLFGVGCGALTAATMYLVWSLFSTGYEYRSSSYVDEDSDDEEEEDVYDVKKMGYVKIPEAEKPVKEAV